MIKHLGLFAGLWLSVGGAAFGQIGAPVLGYVPDGAHLRPVYGIPGAAAVAPVLDLGHDLEQIAISPHQDYALATDASSGAVLLIPAGGSAVALAGIDSNPSLMVISPSGSSAALWFSGNGHIEIVSGLPDNPSVRGADASFVRPLRGDPSAPETPGAFAVSDDGLWVAGAWARGAYAFGPNSEVRSLAVAERPAAMSFFTGSQDLALATSLHLFKIADVGGSAGLSTLLATPGSAPAGLGISLDNRHLLLADRSGQILSLDLNSGATSRLACGCSPAGVFAMGSGGFRLTGLTGGSFRMVDPANTEILYVPLMAGQGGLQ